MAVLNIIHVGVDALSWNKNELAKLEVYRIARTTLNVQQNAIL